MCVDVTFGERQLANVADLRSVGLVVLDEDLHTLPDGLSWQDGWCLCGVDVEAILERSGRQYEPDVFGYVLRS